jgi:hypothetical protein
MPAPRTNALRMVALAMRRRDHASRRVYEFMPGAQKISLESYGRLENRSSPFR